MASNFGWNELYWGAATWGGEGVDVTVLVGAEDGWGRSVWGSGYYGTIVPDANLQLQLETLRAQESLEAQTAYEAAAVARLRTIDNITTQGIESFINEIRKLQDTIQSLLDSKDEYDSEADFFVA